MSEHTNSYYAASLNWQTDYPQLQGEHRCDVAVVGAGFTGISTALYLAEWGYDVAVIEANRVSWGASGRKSDLAAKRRILHIRCESRPCAWHALPSIKGSFGVTT